MAAVMMRAMGVGSSSSKDKTTPAPNGDEEGLSLSRQTSRLHPPYVAGNPHGILINPLRAPSAPNSPPTHGLYSNTSATSSLTSLTIPQPLTSTDLANRTSSYASSLASVPSSPVDDRGRSISRDSASRGQTVSPRPTTAVLAHAFHSDTGLTKVESMGEHRKIRFAPLPEITGRDGDWDVGGLEDEDGSELTRTQSAGLSYERGHLDAEMDDEEDDQDDRERGRGSLFGSWKSDTSFGGRRSGTDDDEGGGSSSYTSKLLRPLSFGLGSKKKRSSSKSRGATSGSDSLSRQSSNESDISRGSSMDGGGFRPTGIPMRKTRTWESGDSGGPRESRRAQYPPVAQRSRTARRPVSISAPDPTFNEWGAGSSVGSVASRGSAKVEEDEDDGGGMAWIKKRRAQREAERKKAEEEEAERKRKEEEEEERKGAEGEGGEEDVPFAIDDAGGEEGEDGEGDRTMEQQTPSGEATPAQQVVKDVTAASAHLSSSSASTPTISTTPKAQQHSLLGMTRPSLNVVTSSPGPSSPALGSGSKSFDHTSSVAVDSPVAIDTPPREATPVAVGHDDGHAQRLSDKLGKLAIGGRSTIHKGPVSPVEYESDEEDSDEDDDEDQDDDDGSDLDDEELQEEERLAEEARRTAKSAGAERFHTATHKSTVVEVEGRRPNAPSRTGTLTQPSRSSTLVPPSRQPTL